MVIFTEDELRSFRLDQLRRIADFYHIDRVGVKKEHLIERLIPLVSLPDPSPFGESHPVSEEGIPVSVRVRRLYEQNRGIQ